MTRTLFTAATAVALAVSLSSRLVGQSRDLHATIGGTATLSGTVVNDEGGGPVSRAIVTVTGVVPAFSRIASTDARGAFVFTDLPAGDVTVTATKAAYLTTYYGASLSSRGPAVPFDLGVGGRSDISIRLVRGGVIAGTVVGPTGRVQAGVEVSAIESRVVNGARRLVGGGRGQECITDNRGRYRIWGLAPGEYVVTASPSDDMAASSIVSTETGRAILFAPVYYPGVVDAATAATVRVDAAGTRDGVDLALTTVTSADIRGTVIGADGRAASGVAISLDDGSPGGTWSLSDANGRFAFHAVPPGNFTMTARGPGGQARTGPAPSDTNLWATIDVAVTGDNQDDVVLTLQPGMTAAGQAVFEGASPPPDPRRALVSVTVAGDVPGGAAPAPAHAGADGTFALTGLAPGHYAVHAAVDPATSGQPGATWVATSVRWQGQDLLDGTLDVEPGQDISGLSVVFSDRQTDLSGTLSDSAGRPVAGFDVVVFAADPRFWTPESRRVEQVLLGRDGRFDFSNLPPGEYLLAAVTHADTDDLADATWLEAVAAMALHTTLAEGEHKVQNLRLGHSS